MNLSMCIKSDIKKANNKQTYMTKIISNGSITLHLAIAFSLLMTLIFYTIESSHQSALACRADSVSYIASDSLFSHYCLPLFEKYGLFALNEQGLDLHSLLETYAEKNCEFSPNPLYQLESFLNPELSNIDIKHVTYLTDNDGRDFVSQICEQVKYLELTNLAEELLDTSKTDFPDIYEQSSYGIPDINFEDFNIDSYTKYAPANPLADGETDENLNGIDCNTFSDSISESIGHMIEESLLSCILKDPSRVSTLSIDKSVLPSVTCDLTIDGLNATYGYYKDKSQTTYEKACFCEYITYTFGNFLNPATDSALNYQTEYIISGSSDDDTNLINTALQLISLRSSLNLIHLFGDKSKFNAAWKISQSASSIPLAPYFIQAIILTVWATAEAVIDVRDLLSGKSVPVLKSKEQWSLSIQGLQNFSKSTSSVNDGKSGLSYSRYLEILLIFQNNISTYYRTMDLIQMDICKDYSNKFRISACVSGLTVEYTYKLPWLFSARNSTYTKKYNYSYR